MGELANVLEPWLGVDLLIDDLSDRLCAIFFIHISSALLLLLLYGWLSGSLELGSESIGSLTEALILVAIIDR